MRENTEHKSAKTVKGMTLIEIIIAMAVFAIAGTVMVRMGAVSKSQLMNSNHLNTKTQVEVAVGTGTQAATELDEEMGGNHEQEVTFKVGSYNVKANRYSTVEADAYSGKKCNTDLKDDASLQFYIMGEVETT